MTIIYGLAASIILFLAPIADSVYGRRRKRRGTTGEGEGARRPGCDYYWAGGTALTTCGTALLLLQGFPTVSAWISIVLANGLLYVGMAVINSGLVIFRGLRPRPLRAALIPALATCLLAAFTFIHPSVQARIIVFSLTSTCLYGFCAASCVKTRDEVRGPMPYVAAADFGMLSAFFLVRAVVNAFEVDSSILAPGFLNSLTYFIGGFGVIVWALSLTLLKNATLLRDMSRGEELYRGIFQSADVGIFQSTREGEFIRVNQAFADMFGYASFEELLRERGPSTGWLYAEEGKRDRLLSAIEEEGHIRAGPHRATKKGGEALWFLINVSLVQRAEGRNILTGTIVDVTERVLEDEALKRANDEKSFLLKELQHRIKNGLAIITSLIELESTRSGEETSRGAFRDLGDKVQALASLYDLLYLSRDPGLLGLAPYLRSVIEVVCSGYGAGDKGIEVRVDIEELSVDFKMAEALGLITVELVTDAFKHGFPEDRRGSIGIRLEKSGGNLVLDISDDGVDLPPGFSISTSTGLGLGIVEALAAQHRGSFSVLPGSGARFRIVLPM